MALVFVVAGVRFVCGLGDHAGVEVREGSYVGRADDWGCGVNKRAKKRRQAECDMRIKDAWDSFIDVEPCISIERLIQQVADECGLEVDRVVDGLSRMAGRADPTKRMQRWPGSLA